jgi:hypothetical protein
MLKLKIYKEDEKIHPAQFFYDWLGNSGTFATNLFTFRKAVTLNFFVPI